MNQKPIFVAFANPKLEKDFEKLKKGKFEDAREYSRSHMDINLELMKENLRST